MTERAPKLTLTYHRFSASAETLRLAAAIGKIRFTNKAIEHDEWKPPRGKDADPCYKLPVLEIEVKGQEKQVVAHRNAILHYLGRRGGLYPIDPLEGLQIEYMLETVSEALRPLEVSNDGGVSSLLSEYPLSGEQLLRIREGIANNAESGLPHYLRFFELALRENKENKESKWLVGTDVSIADLKLYQLVCWISGGIGDGDGPSLLNGIEASLIENYPRLLKHKMQIETLPEVMSWRSKHSPPYSVFEHRPPFEFRSIGRRSRLGNHHNPIHPAVGRVNPGMGGTQGKPTASIPRLTLSYFETAGRAEPIRLAAAIGKVPFTNRTMVRGDWSETKRFSPLKQLPTLMVIEPGKDLVTAPQSTAILRYFGKLGGLYPADEMEAVQVEFMMESIAHALRLVEMTTTGAVKSLVIDVLFNEEEERQQIQRRVMSDRNCGLPLYLNYFESILEGKQGHSWLVGKSLTVADLSLYHLSNWLGGSADDTTCTLDPPPLRDFPHIRQHTESIDKLELVKRFRKRYSPPYSTFDFFPGQDEAENFERKSRDNLPKGPRRKPSTDGLFLPKNPSRSRSSDQINKAAPRHPSFSPHLPKRRSSRDDGAQQLGKDKMMGAPLRRKASFDDEVLGEWEDEPPKRKSRGASMPPRQKPLIILDHDDDDDDCFSFSERSSDSDDLPADLLTRSLTRTKRDEIVDESSTGSFDDESTVSSADLDRLHRQQQTLLGTGKDAATPHGPAPYDWKADKKKRRRKKRTKRLPQNSARLKSAPKLPANTPRNRPSLEVSKKGHKKNVKRVSSEPGRLKKAVGQMKRRGSDVPMYKWSMETKESESTEQKSEVAEEPMYKWSAEETNTKKSETTDKAMYKWERDKEKSEADGPVKKKTITPKSQRRLKKLPSNSPRGGRRFPSNTRRSMVQPRMPSDFKDDDDLDKEGTTEAKGYDAFARQAGDSHGELKMQKSGSFTSKKKRILVYFDVPGRAESIRLAAVIARLPFTNLSIPSEESDASHKHMAPLDQFPVLEIEEAHNRRLTVPQSMAILRYVGTLGGLYPQDPLDALAVDSMCDSVDDALRLIETTCRSSNRSILEFKFFSDEECAEMRQRVAEDEENGITGILSFFERVLENNFSKFGVWVAQSTVTIADLRLYQLHTWLSGSFGACLRGDRLDGMPPDILKGFPLLELHKERVEEIAEVMAFRSHFSWPYSTFYFDPDEENEQADDVEDAYLIGEESEIPRLTLTHAWNTLNAEPIRLAAAIGKLSFTNKLVEPESQEWKNIYERRFTLTQLPVLEIEEAGADKKFITQPLAILRYLCKLGNLYPKNPIRALEVESMVETITEIQHLLNISMDDTKQSLMSGAPWSENETWSVRRRIAKNKEQGLPYYLAYFEKAKIENPSSTWLVGPSVTIADLYLHNFLSFITRAVAKDYLQESAAGGDSHSNQLDGLPDGLMDDFPVLSNHTIDVENLSAVASFRGKFQPPYKTFEFRPTGT